MTDDPSPSPRIVPGQAVNESDVQTVSDAPIAAGTVIVVPPARLKDFWKANGKPSAGPAGAERAEFTVSRSDLPNGVETATITGGRFITRLAAPGALFCLAPTNTGVGAGNEAAPSYRVVGCAVLAGDDQPTGVRVARGEAGVTVRPE